MSDSEEDACVERQVKVSLVGEPATGKSLLCARYLGAPCAAGPTQGSEVLLGGCCVRPGRAPAPLKLQDVAGGPPTHRDSSMLDNYLYASHVVIFVYDVTSLSSFEHLPLWVSRVLGLPWGARPPLLAVYGNKTDLEHQRAVRLAQAKEFADSNQMQSFTGSARTGENVNSLFVTLVSQVLGVPVNKSLFTTSIVRAELAPQSRRQPIAGGGKKPTPSKPTNRSPAKTKSNKEQNNEKQKSTKNKKTMKDFTMKASSAVCILQ